MADDHALPEAQPAPVPDTVRITFDGGRVSVACSFDPQDTPRIYKMLGMALEVTLVGRIQQQLPAMLARVPILPANASLHGIDPRLRGP